MKKFLASPGLVFAFISITFRSTIYAEEYTESIWNWSSLLSFKPFIPGKIYHMLVTTSPKIETSPRLFATRLYIHEEGGASSYVLPVN